MNADLGSSLAALVDPDLLPEGLLPGDRVAVSTSDPARIVAAVAAALRAGATAILLGPGGSGIPDAPGATVRVGDTGSPRRLGDPLKTAGTAGRVAIATGGSTGVPRFVVHDASTLAAAARSFAAGLGGGPIHGVAPLPAWHVGGLMPAVRAAISGGRWQAGTDYRQLDARACAGAVVSLVPTQLRRLLGEPASVEALRAARLLLLGGASTPPALVEDALAAGLPLALSYGLTEAAATVAWLPADDLRADPTRRDGRLLPGIEARIEPEAPDASTGRLVLAGASIALGRLDAEGRLAPFEAVASGRAVRTSDRASLPAPGRVAVLGRLDRLVITGGEKVDPDAVAARVVATGLASEAHAFGEPDPDWGERLVLAVAPAPADPRALEVALRATLPPAWRPKRLVLLDRLPRTALGKIDHARLAAPGP